MTEPKGSASAYSQSKALYHTGRLAVLRNGGQPTPAHVQLILSDLCNQSCRFCAYRADGYTSNELFHVIDPVTGEKNHNPNRMISRDKAIEILDDCAAMGVKAIQFTGGGEPTVHPDHLEIFRYARGLGLEIALVTHGALLRDEAIDFLAAEASWVRISIDAGSPATYAAVRRIGEAQFHRAWENVHKLAARKAPGGDPVIGVGFVVTRDNWREVVEAATRAKAAGADSFRISAVFQSEGESYFSDFRVDAVALCKHAESLSSGNFRVTNSFGTRLQDLQLGNPDYSFCGYQHFTTYIGATLDVFRCCNLAYSTRGRIGSIKDQRFIDLWDSEQKRLAFSTFDARGCERCQFNGQNRAILAAIEQPKHVNFV